MSKSSTTSLFVPHGAPTFALQPGAAGAAMTALAARLSTPCAIVIVSAHWDTPQPRIGAALTPETIHDYWGFPPALNRLVYPAPGSPELAGHVRDALRAQGFAAELEPNRGLDHGAWIPLRQMFPAATIPVVPLSIQSHAGAEHHWRLGQALSQLAADGVLVLGSGNLTHNLRDYQLGSDTEPAPSYVRAFADWMWLALKRGDVDAVLNYRTHAPQAIRAHPSDEHLLPLFVALGAAGAAGAEVSREYAGIDSRVLAMDLYAFRPVRPH